MDLPRILYETVPGRVLLRLLIDSRVSFLAGRLMDSRLSAVLIPGFIRRNRIEMSDYLGTSYPTFNDFFCRRIDPEKRPVDQAGNHLAAPCDGLLSVYRISGGLVMPVKQSSYTVSELLRDERLAKEFEGGTSMVFRLCVHHYHRYIFPDSARRGSEEVHIDGVLHTVRPAALHKVPVFIENTREYVVLETEHFGKMIQMEVGAMLVGRICNHRLGERVKRGQEKGYFQYGGSTIILLAKRGAVQLSGKLFEATENQIEIPVRMGQKIGVCR